MTIRRSARTTACAAALLVGIVAPAIAQTSAESTTAAPSRTRIYTTVGRTWVNGHGSLQLDAGAETSPFSERWALTVEGSATHHEFGAETTLALLGGLTFRRHSPDGWVTMFFRGLAGVSRSFGQSGFSTLVGAGVDVPIRPRWGIRAMADVPIGYFDGGTDIGFRLTAGAVFPLGPNTRQ
jgi:hypothetical protein